MFLLVTRDDLNAPNIPFDEITAFHIRYHETTMLTSTIVFVDCMRTDLMLGTHEIEEFRSKILKARYVKDMTDIFLSSVKRVLDNITK